MLAGHTEAFERLMRRHNALVFRTARAVVRSDAAAEDCAQQAWILAFDRLHQLDDRAGFAPWVARISYRQALRMARFDRSRGNVALEPLETEQEDSTVTALSSTPEQETQRTELRTQLESSIDALPAALREPFVLCEVHQLSARETGDLLGSPNRTCASDPTAPVPCSARSWGSYCSRSWRSRSTAPAATAWSSGSCVWCVLAAERRYDAVRCERDDG